MPKQIPVPEPDVKAYTKEQLHRIALKHKAIHGSLPYPDPVFVPPLRNPPPRQNRLWQAARHFILGGVSTGLTVLMTTKSLTFAGAGFVAGGVAAAVRKNVDDNRRAANKPDLLTTAKDKLTRRPVTEGVEVNPILTMLLGSLDTALVMLKNAMATSDEASKYVKAVCWNVLYFEDELREMAAKTETAYDDAFVTELIEAATTIWGE